MNPEPQQPRRVLVLGASGGIGSWVCRLGAERRWEISAALRPGSPPPLATAGTLRGDVLSREFLARALPGHDAVISCLGLRRAVPRNPWSRITSPHDLTRRVAEHLVALMPPLGLRRLVVVSAAGVGDSLRETSPLFRMLIQRSNLGPAYRDLNEMEQVLRQSPLDWTAVRPVTLTSHRPGGPVGIVQRYGLRSRIARADVARWMLEEVIAARAGQTPMIGRVRPGAGDTPA